MLNEPASSASDRPRHHIPAESNGASPSSQKPHDARLWQIKEMVADVLAIESERGAGGVAQDNNPLTTDNSPASGAAMALDTRVIAGYVGRLMIDSEAAYTQLDGQFESLDLLPIFRDEDGKHVIYVVEGRINPAPRPWWPNLALFVVTFFSVLMVGVLRAANDAAFYDTNLAQAIVNDLMGNMWRGLPYAISVLLILGAHELGHYFAARRHKLAVTLPYFLPLPFGGFGTFGAFIQLRQPIRNRKMLLDIGASGPLAGLVFAVPILLIGLATSPRGPIPPAGILEGNSIFYGLAKIILFGEFLPNGQIDVFVNQLAWAGWIGLFITGLNLIPLGQLDGGHVTYSILGERARLLYFPVIAGMAFITLLSEGELLIMLLLLLFLGRAYATPLDNITQLDPRRRWIAIGTLVVFVLVFVPVPLIRYDMQSRSIFDFSASLDFSVTLPLAVSLVMQLSLKRLLRR